MNLLTVIMAEPAGPGAMGNIIMFVLIIAVFYLFMIRPQIRKQKEGKKFMESLEKGQRVVTVGGIHGKIDEIRDTTIIILTEGGGKLKMNKTAISADSATLIGNDK